MKPTVLQVKLEQLHVVVITDYTKAGVLSTQTLNKHAAAMSRILQRNQRCSLF